MLEACTWAGAPDGDDGALLHVRQLVGPPGGRQDVRQEQPLLVGLAVGDPQQVGVRCRGDSKHITSPCTSETRQQVKLFSWLWQHCVAR